MDTQGIGRPFGKKPRPQKEQALNCPRCNSTNTKFCYYNNYSLSQPRYFCKTCRRYWTEGGCLRSVPVGGGSRKTKTPSSSSSSKINKVIIPNYDRINNPSPPSFSSPDQNPYKIQSNPCHYNNIGVSSEFSALPFGLDSKNIQNPSFSVDGLENGYGNLQGVEDDNLSRDDNMVFTFGDLEQVLNSDKQFEQDRAQGEVNGFWNEMLDGGSW